jgi:hypothetical protein
MKNRRKIINATELDFDLFGKESIGRLFRLKYFTEAISDRDIHILCDMERL